MRLAERETEAVGALAPSHGSERGGGARGMALTLSAIHEALPVLRALSSRLRSAEEPHAAAASQAGGRRNSPPRKANSLRIQGGIANA